MAASLKKFSTHFISKIGRAYCQSICRWWQVGEEHLVLWRAGLLCSRTFTGCRNGLKGSSGSSTKESKICPWGGITPGRISKEEWVEWLESSLGEEEGVQGGNNEKKENQNKRKEIGSLGGQVARVKSVSLQWKRPVMFCLYSQEWVQWRATEVIDGGWSIWCTRRGWVNLLGLKRRRLRGHLTAILNCLIGE